jgi:rhodanese-related sulfurtransferase
MRIFTLFLTALAGTALISCEKGAPVAESDAPTAVAAPAAGPIDLDGAKAAEVLASDPAIIVLDVRTAEEFAEGHIKGAVNIDFNGDDFETKIAALDPAKAYLVHCQAGGRSGQSLPLFEKLKFSRLYHLSTGFGGWVADGQPVER